MTSISSNTAALSLLQQGSVLPGAEGQKNATDAILDIVAGQLSSSKKTAAATGAPAAAVPQATVTTSPREVGGSVSGEISRGQLSGMAAGGQVALMPNREVGATTTAEGQAIGDDGGDNALRYVASLIHIVQQSNLVFHPEKPPTREEWTALGQEVKADLTKRGVDTATIQRRMEMQFSDKGYENRVNAIKAFNNGEVESHVRVASTLSVIQGFLSGTFNVETKVDYDEKGEAKLRAFEFSYGNGRGIKYQEDGNLTLTRADGATRTLDYARAIIAGQGGQMHPDDQSWYEGK